MFKGKKQSDMPETQQKKRGFFANFFEPLDDGESEGDEGLLDDGMEEDEPDEDELPKQKKQKKKHRSLWDYANEDFDDAEEEKKRGKQKAKAAAKRESDEDAELEIRQEVVKPIAPAEEAEEPENPKAGRDPEKIRLFGDDADASASKEAEDSRPAGEGEAPAEEDIRLFENGEYDEDTEEGRTRGSRATIIKTGTGTAARVHINETEELQRTEKAQKERREREAERKHREFLTKQQQKQERQRMIKRAAGNIAFGGLIVVGVLLTLYYAFLLSDIVVVGNETYSSEYIIKESGLRYGQHMLTVNLDEAEAMIEDDPYLQVDSITYIFPARVRIAVTERKEVAGIIGLDYNVIIDDSGYVLAMGAGTDISKLLQVTGVNMTGFQLGQRLGEGDDFSTATLITMIEKLEEYNLMGNIKAIDLTTPLATTMTASNGLKVFVGQPTDLDAKFLSLQTELPAFLKQNIYWGSLFLSAKGGTVYSPREMSQILAETTTAEPETPNEDPNYVNPDQDGDGYNDDTGEAMIPSATTSPELPAATPSGGGEDDFQG